MNSHTLQDICTTLTDGTHHTPKNLRTGVPFLTVKDMNPTGLDLAGCSRISSEDYDAAAAANCAPLRGDVLFSKDGTVGKVHVVSDEPNFAVLSSIAILRPNLKKVDANYLGQMLKTPKVLEQATDRKTGSAIRRIILSDLKQVRIPLPAIEEQRRIAAILDQAEALRAKRSQALDKLDTLTQSLFLEMFGDPASNLKKWPMMPLRKAWAEPPNYGTMVPPTSSGDWLSLRVANIQHDRLDLKDRKFVSLPSRDILRHSLQNGDIIMARAIASQAHLGKCVVVNTEEKFWAFDSHLMRLRLNKSLMMPEFLRAMLTTKGGRTLFLSVTRRSAVQFNVNTKEMGRLELPVPPVHLQKEFVSAVELVEERRKSFHRGYDLLGVTRSSLQHRAFRGEL